MMNDIGNRVNGIATIKPQTLSADLNGSAVDLNNFNSAAVFLMLGDEGDTLSSTVKIDFKLQHADADASGNADSWSDVTDSTHVTYGAVDANGIFATANDSTDAPKVYKIGYIGGRRFIRVVADFTGTHTNGTPISALVLKGDPRDSADTMA